MCNAHTRHTIDNNSSKTKKNYNLIFLFLPHAMRTEHRNLTSGHKWSAVFRLLTEQQKRNGWKAQNDYLHWNKIKYMIQRRLDSRMRRKNTQNVRIWWCENRKRERLRCESTNWKGRWTAKIVNEATNKVYMCSDDRITIGLALSPVLREREKKQPNIGIHFIDES